MANWVQSTDSFSTACAVENGSGNDSAGFKASGTYGTSSSASYGFNENESSTDSFVLNQTMPGSMNGVGTVTQSLVTSLTGST
jgi:hypothetical protein